MKYKYTIKQTIIILSLLIVSIILSYVRGLVCDELNIIFGILSLIILIVDCVIWIKTLDHYGINWITRLLFVIGIFIGCSVVVEEYYIYNSTQAQRKALEGHSYWVMPAKIRSFSFFYFCFGWHYDLIIGDKMIDAELTAWLPNCDTILIGVLSNERGITNHFIYDKHPTSKDIEHAKNGWYMENNTEKPFNEFKFNDFMQVILKNDNNTR